MFCIRYYPETSGCRLRTKSFILLFLQTIFCLTYNNSNAQSSRFNAGFVAGLNFAELEGDGVTDYFGLNAGVIGTAKLTERYQLGMEILFSQNGEYVLPVYYPPLQYGKVSLNHIEVPIHFDWLIGFPKKEEYYHWNINIGLAYARLLSYKAETSDKIDVTDQVVYEKMDALLLQAGTTYYFTKHFGLNLKASLPIRNKGLSWTLACRLIYVIK